MSKETILYRVNEIVPAALFTPTSKDLL